MMMLLALALAPALAQDGVNAHGFYLVPSDGDSLDLLGTWRPERQQAGSFGLTGLFEYADSPLVLVRREGDDLVRDPLVDSLAGLNIGATFAGHERFAVALSAPVYFTSAGPDGFQGPALGDMRLSVPIGLILNDEGFGLSAIPFADLPTGATARFLGNQGLAGGAILAAGYKKERFAASANVGYRALPAIDYENLQGGDKVLLAVGGGYEVTDWLAARAEVVISPTLLPNAYAYTDSPGEGLLSFRGRYDTGLSWTAGAALPITRGAGAAAFRAFLGLGYTVGKNGEADTDGDGLVDSLDACPTEPETFNGFQDDDGCPDSLSDFTLVVVNEDGEPVPDAQVTLAEEPRTLDAQGQFALAKQMPGTSLSATVTHPHYEEATLEAVALDPGTNEARVVLKYLPGRVHVITKSNTGNLLDARVRFAGPVDRDPENVGPEGNKVFHLRPGDWQILVSAEAFGTERRELTIRPGETSLVVIEVILHPTKTEVKDEEIHILDQVLFDFDKDTIRAESLPLLDQVANVLLDNPQIQRVEVQGHTDNRGRPEYNKELSQRRVESVRTYLIGQGVAPDRLVARGFGMDKPIASNATDAGRAKNRRVQFVILNPEDEGSAD